MEKPYLILKVVKTSTGKIKVSKGKLSYTANHPCGISITIDLPEEMGTLSALKLSLADVQFIK